MESKRLWIWLQNAVGVGWTHSADLLQQFGDDRTGLFSNLFVHHN